MSFIPALQAQVTALEIAYYGLPMPTPALQHAFDWACSVLDHYAGLSKAKRAEHDRLEYGCEVLKEFGYALAA